MWFKIKSFLSYFFSSTNKHGVHSPFVYSLITNCFEKKTPASKIKLYQTYKKWLIQNNSIIKITDFGGGSKIFKTNERKVSDIVKVAGITKKKAKLLLNCIDYLNIKTILEIGSSVGLSTATISIENPNLKITTIEGCPKTSKIAEELFNNFSIKNIELINGNFNSIIPKLSSKNKYDLIYFDGNHQKEPTLFYFENCLKAVHNNSIFIFDDINWSEEMQEAWLKIKEHPKVTVTINMYFWGLVFFRSEQKKQHFTLRV